MRACGECSKPVRKYGGPVRHGYFIDQIVVCTKCDWIGVETEIIEEDTPIQLELFGAVELEDVINDEQ